VKFPKIFTNTVLYSLSSFLQKGIGFLLLPIYTYYLTPEDYGMLNVVTTIVAFLSQLFMMSLHGAASRFHFKSERADYHAKVWGTILMLVLANSVFWGILVMVFHKYLIDPVAKGIAFYPLFFFSILGTIFSPLYQFYQQWLRNLQNGVRYTINAIAFFLLQVVLNLIGLVVLGLGVLSPVLSSLIVAVVFFGISIWRFVPNISFRFDKNLAKDAVKYSLPLVPHNIAGYWSMTIDRIMLNNMLSTSSVGLYSVGSQFGLVIGEIAMSINKAYSPWCYNIMTKNKEEGYEKMYVFADMSILVLCLIAMIISIYSPEVVSLMASEAFSMAWMPVTFICFGKVAHGLYFFFCQPLFFSHTKYVMYVSLSALIANIVCCYFFIPVFGIIGTGLALFASTMVIAVMALILSKWLEPHIQYHYKRMIAMCFVFLGVSLSVFLFQSMIDNFLFRIMYKFIFVILIIGVMVFANKKEIAIVLEVIKMNKN
jgi:O-antigen/teichoic acid export membrane protein